MLALGFASGLPFYLIFDTLSAWLRQVGLSLEVIGLFSLATLVFSFKFLWAPLVDRASVPVLGARLGHRRSWMLLCQILIIGGLWTLAGLDPTRELGLMAVVAVLVGFVSATQDIALDAWRIEAVGQSRQGAMTTAHQWGYRIATILSGAIPLVLAETYGWHVSYGVMAALMGFGILATLAAPRETHHEIREIHLEGTPPAPARDLFEWAARLAILAMGALILGSGLAANATLLSSLLSAVGLAGIGHSVAAVWRSSSGLWFQMLAVLIGFIVITVAVWPIPGLHTRPGAYLGTALGEPLREFFNRYGRQATLVLALVCLYRLSDFLVNIMNPYYLDLGFTLTEVAEVRKVLGVVGSMVGVSAGGYAIARFGLRAAMIVGAIGGPVSNLLFVWLAIRGHDIGALFVAITLDNVFSGFAGTCLVVYMSSLTAKGFTATQYALFSSLYAIPGKILASQSGRIVEAAAHNVENGGSLSIARGLFTSLPAESFVKAYEKSGVSPVALASGYSIFFTYTCLVGLIAIVLTIAVMRREPAKTSGEATS